MSGATVTHVSPERLSRLRWRGEDTYRVLSYYFSLRWNFDAAGDHLRQTLGPFAVPPDPDEARIPATPGLPPQYSVIRQRNGGGTRYSLLFGTGVLTESKQLWDVLDRFLWHVNTEGIRQTGDFLLIHAGSVVTPGGDGVILPGASGSGKTTLVAGLVEAGFGYLSDEAAAIDPVTRRLYPFPKALSLKSEDPPVLFPQVREGRPGVQRARFQWHVSAEALRPSPWAGPCPVRYVFAPAYEPEALASLAPMTPAEAAARLLRHTLNLPRYRSRAVHLVAEIVRGAEAYDLVSGDLEGSVQAIRQIVQRKMPLGERHAQGLG
jgi:hypothetical protein